MNTETANGIALISDQSGQMMFPDVTAGPLERLVKTSQLQENEQDLTETEVLLFGKYIESWANSKKKIDPNGLSTKMLRECCRAITGGDFLSILMEMDELGYDIEWFTFNSKYHGVPQNRERVYTIGHLRRYGRCKILPISGTTGEDSVQRKINIIGHRDGYRRNTQTFDYNGITEALDTAAGGGREKHTAIPMFGIDKNIQGTEIECANALTAREDRGLNEITSDAFSTCTARDYKGVNFRDLNGVCIPVLTPDRANKRQNGRRMKENGDEAFTLTAQDKHGVALKIREATVKGYAEAEIGNSINLSMPESKTRRGRVGKKQANTLDTSCSQGVPVIWYDKYNCYIAIRKLTPKECFRLQGWTDDYFEKAQFVNSDSQLYKQAGNGVTVNVVYEIGKAIANARVR